MKLFGNFVNSINISDFKFGSLQINKVILDVPLPGGLFFSPTYLQAGLIVVLIFLLVLLLGQLRHRLVNWEFKGIIPGIVMGFLLATILEGLLLVSGSTALIKVLGWKNAPKPISNVLDMGREKLTNVLGVSNAKVEIKNVTSTSVLEDYRKLNASQSKTVRLMICQ